MNQETKDLIKFMIVSLKQSANQQHVFPADLVFKLGGEAAQDILNEVNNGFNIEVDHIDVHLVLHNKDNQSYPQEVNVNGWIAVKGNKEKSDE